MYTYLFLLCLFHGFTLLSSEPLEAAPVTCGSAIKLSHKETDTFLSLPKSWGSGSSQQSVTSTGSMNDASSLWLVKEKYRSEVCEAGSPIKCGDIIRLEHMSTKKNLHSHLFQAALSGNQEVSGYGDGDSGDTGDNWKIVCETSDKTWQRGSPITLQHVDTGKYLYAAEKFKFTQQNCGGGCPIMGQNEVSASTKKDVMNRWIASQGMYIAPNSKSQKDEL